MQLRTWLAIVLEALPIVVGLVVARTLGVIAQRANELYARESLLEWPELREAYETIARPNAVRPAVVELSR